MRIKAMGRRAVMLAGLSLVPVCSAFAQFEYGSVAGVVFDSITRKPVGGTSVVMRTMDGNGRGNTVRRDDHFDFSSVPVGDSVSLTMHYSACFAPIAKTQRIRASGIYFSSGGILDSTFTPCAYEPLATALSVCSYPAQMRFAKHVYRSPEASYQSVGVYPRMYIALL